MAPRLEVLKDDTTARVWFYPDEGRPTSTPSVAIHDESGNVITAASTTSVTLSTANTALSAEAASGAQSVILTVVTGVEVGKTYLITNALGQKEWVSVRSVNSSTKAVGLDERLEYTHASAATFVGCYFYRALGATETASLEQGWRAVATYAVGGINYSRRAYFDVAKVMLQSPLTVAFVKKYLPDIMPREYAQTRGSDYAAFREVAWDRIQNSIRQYSTEQGEFRPALNRTPEYLDDWALDMFRLIAFQGGVRNVLRDIDPTEALRTLERNENLSRERCLTTCSWDKNEDDAVGIGEVATPRMDLIR